MSFEVGFDAPFYTGTTSISTDSRYDVGLAGHGYIIDTDREDEFRHESVQMIRQQADTSTRPGEQSINPEGLWRRSQVSWHHGAGQSWLDRDDTDPFRFNTSKGVNPWEPYGLTLLPDTQQLLASGSTNLYLATTGTRLYATSGQTVRATTTLGGSWDTCTGTPAATATSIASDGATVYVGFGSSGLYSSTGTAFTSHSTGTASLVRFCKGRLIVSTGKALYNVTASGGAITSGTVLLDHPNASWLWTDCAPGRGAIFATGYAGDKSLIYRIDVKQDGTGLDVAVPCGELPDGEIARSLTGYLGFLLVGTDKGVRFAAVSDGEVTLGALIPTDSPVLCGEGQDRFVWYGLTNYDGTSTGLGRLDLTQFTSTLTPAYASDLMVTGQGSVGSVVTFSSRRVFTVQGLGVHAESASLVASGQISSGRIGFGLPDDKTALYLTVRHDPLDADETVTMYLSVEGEDAQVVGLSDVDASTAPGHPFVLNQTRGNDFEWTAVLEGDVALRSVTLRADPSSERTEFIYVPLLLREKLDVHEVEESMDVAAEKQFLIDLRDTRRVVTYQEGTESTRVIVDDTVFRPWRKTSTGNAYQGTLLVRLKEV